MPATPKILHQTWATKDLPLPFASLRASWKKHHPQWALELYDDDDCDRFVASRYPEWLERYRKLPRPVLKADLFRYLILYAEGGLYADIDMRCFRPVDALLNNPRALFCVEAHLTDKRKSELSYPHPYQLANCIFAAPAKHPFLARILDEVATRILTLSHSSEVTDECIESMTGPRMLTRLYYTLTTEERTQICVLPQVTLMGPQEYDFLVPFSPRMYTRHETAGSWKTEKRSRSIRERLTRRNRLPWPWPKTEQLLP